MGPALFLSNPSRPKPCRGPLPFFFRPSSQQPSFARPKRGPALGSPGPLHPGPLRLPFGPAPHAPSRAGQLAQRPSRPAPPDGPTPPASARSQPRVAPSPSLPAGPTSQLRPLRLRAAQQRLPRDLRRDSARARTPKSPGPLYLAPTAAALHPIHSRAAPRTPRRAAHPRRAAPLLRHGRTAPLRRSPGRTARRLRLDARVFPEPFPSAATHTDPGSTSLRELHRRATAGRRRRAPYAGHLLQYTAR